MIPMGIDLATKQESNSNNNGDDTKTTSWSRLKDPRIVRVSRALGGKDRHSKVCTVRGLRDRRVRLSVPTAIQLYDLQERLSLSQPSKVVDWLLDAAKHEIDKLPPLQIPQGIMLTSHHFSDPSKLQGGKLKENASAHDHHHHPSWTRNGDGDERFEVEANFQQNPASFTSLMRSSSSSSSSFGRWDPSSLSLSSHAHEDLHSFNNVMYPSMITQPYLTPQINAAFHHHPTPRPLFNFNMAVDRHNHHSS